MSVETMDTATLEEPYLQKDMGCESGRSIGFIEVCRKEIHMKTLLIEAQHINQPKATI